MTQADSSTASRAGGTRFGVWLLVGAIVAFFGLSMPTLGLVAVLVAGVVAGWRSRRQGLPGLLVGAALPLFWVAWLNRDGPGFVTFRTPTGQGGRELLDPLPWLVAGLLLLGAAGALLGLARNADEPPAAAGGSSV